MRGWVNEPAGGPIGGRVGWQRFWYPRGGIPLLERDVFLWDPRDPIAQRINDDVGSLDRHDATPVLVLLGEPGIGKSDAAEARNAVASWPSKVINLPDVVDLEVLKGNIREGVDLLSEGAPVVELIFDGLDEAMVRDPKSDKWLSSALAVTVPADWRARLRIRVTCRPAVWPETLGEALARLWQVEAATVLVMAPLRIRDVDLAAGARGVDPCEFLAQLSGRGLLCFAARPVTLLPLLDMFREGRLPDSNVELCRWLTRRLAGYDSRGHYDARLASPAPGPAKVEVAGRLGALSLLSGRPVLARSGPGTELGPGDLDVDEAQRGGSPATAIDPAAVMRALDSALFNAAGTDRFRFAHRSHAEFLAADTLERSGLPTTSLLLLVQGPDGTSIFPQVAEVAAWLAVLRPELFDELVSSEPELLLTSDVATRSDEDRGRLVGALLARQDEVPAPHLPLEHLHKLRGSAVGAVVTEYLFGQHNVRAKEAALAVAGASGDAALVSAVVDVVADPGFAAGLREYAAFALPARLSPGDGERLKAVVAAGSGVSDELRGRVLTRLWPEHLSLGEVLALAVDPAQPEVHSAYRQFLRVTLPSNVSPGDMAALLRWSLPAARSGVQLLAEAADAALEAAAPHLSDPAVAEAAAPVIIARQDGRGPWRNTADGALRTAVGVDQARRALTAAVVQVSTDSAAVERFVLHYGTPGDFGWALGRLADAGRPVEERRRWAAAARRLFDPSSHPEHLDQLGELSDDPTVAEAFRLEIGGVPISGVEADASRARFREIQEWERLRQPGAQERTLRLEVVDAALAGGGDDAWPRVSAELEYAEGGTANVRVTGFASWAALGDDRRAWAAGAARRWVLTGVPPGPDQPNVWPPEVFDALRALWLAVDDDPSVLEAVDADRCGRWARLLIGVASVGAPDVELVRRDELLAVCRRRAPNETRAAMLAELDADAIRVRPTPTEPEVGAGTPSSAPRSAAVLAVYAYEGLAAVWDSDLSEALFAWQAAQPDEVGLAETVPFLSAHGLESAEHLAVQMLDDATPGPSGSRRRAAAAFALLCCESAPTNWSRIWAAVQADAETGLGLIERLQAPSWSLHPGLGELSPGALADLYLWLRPRAPRPGAGAGFTHPLTAAADAILRHLQAQGTDDAVQALQRIAEAVPADESLPYLVAEGRRRRLEASWNPPSPAEVRALLDEPTRLLATSDRDLAAAVAASLRHAQYRISGQTPAVADLWDHPHDPKRRAPKQEPQLSDWMKRHLQDDLVSLLVNREVEISPGWKDAEQGERVDLHVTASLPGDAGRTLQASMIVENKGCWNAGLDKDIAAQLVERYMRRLGSHHGVYLVLWFDCKRSGSKRACSSCGRRNRDQLEQELRGQAAPLAQNGDHVTVVVLDASLAGLSVPS